METLEELKAKQRANQRQELLAIAYGNAPDKMRQEALKLLQEMDVQEELQTALKIVRKELDQAAAQEPQQISRSAKCEATRANLRPMSASARDHLRQWCKPNKIAVFDQEKTTIYNDLVAGADDKAIERRIYALYSEMRTAIINDTGERIKRPNWKEYLRDCADAYGVILHPYKPSQLK